MFNRQLGFFLGVFFVSLIAIASFSTGNELLAALNMDRLSDKDVERVKTVLAKLAPLIQERDKGGTLPTLTFKELYAPLDKQEKKFLTQFQKLKAKKLGVKTPYRGIASGSADLMKIDGQKVSIQGALKEVPPQFLPRKVYKNYLKMMADMKHDFGRGLLIESGYRSSAYQLYLFVYYLQNHDYSIRETVKWVALPGYSEHGSIKYQAIDFISENGISGETDPKEFENLKEYQWLTANAGKYGFVLSYPKDKPGITFEPWHWRFEEKLVKETKKAKKKSKKSSSKSKVKKK